MKHSVVLLALTALTLAGCSTSGEVSTESLRAPFAENKSQTDGCYERVKKREPDLGSGNVELKFLISDAGKAYKTIFLKKRSTLQNKMLNACLKKVVHSWQFPAGKAVDVTYAFNFGLAMEEDLSDESAEVQKQTELDIVDNSPQDEAPAEGATEGSGDESTGEETPE